MQLPHPQALSLVSALLLLLPASACSRSAARRPRRLPACRMVLPGRRRTDRSVSGSAAQVTQSCNSNVESGRTAALERAARADPLRLPWGMRYDVDLEAVQSAGEWMPVSGGLRVTYYFNERAPQLPPELRAGDRIETLARARLVRNFGDPGLSTTERFSHSKTST